jgi:predicted  nucleic acid-binding Zn-ribbon protein
MQHPKISKIQKIKYFFILLKKLTILAIIAIDETMLCRIITDLTLKGFSLNQIREHFQFCYGLDLSKHSVVIIQKEAARKAKNINNMLDRKVASKISTTEADEIFQGKKRIILGAADKKSSYLMALQACKDRSEESIKEFIQGIAKKYFNIRIIITDLFTSYKKIAKETLPKARHLLCHVHARRLIMRKMEKLQVALKKLKKNLKQNDMTLTKLKKKINDQTDEIKNLTSRIKTERVNLTDLKTKKKTSKSSRTKTIDNQIDTTSKRITRLSNMKTDLVNNLGKLRTKRDNLVPKVKKGKKSIQKAHNILLQSGRLAKQFYDLLNDISPEFLQHLEKYLENLENSSYPIAATLKKMINTNPQLFSLRKKRDLKPNYQNTNTIEGIFGLFRPLLNSTRLLNTEDGTNNYCALFRLYHNTTPPYTGINNKISPVERLGVKLGGKNYLDLIFPTRKRVTHFIVTQEKVKTSLGIIVRRVAHPMCECLS